MLISDKQTAIRIDLQPCKDKPNHTTYGHSRSPTWQPFTSSHPKSSPLHPYSRACPHLIAHGGEPAAFGLPTLLALREGGLPVQNTADPTRRYCRLRRFTVPHIHSM